MTQWKLAWKWCWRFREHRLLALLCVPIVMTLTLSMNDYLIKRWLHRVNSSSSQQFFWLATSTRRLVFSNYKQTDVTTMYHQQVASSMVLITDLCVIQQLLTIDQAPLFNHFTLKSFNIWVQRAVTQMDNEIHVAAKWYLHMRLNKQFFVVWWKCHAKWKQTPQKPFKHSKNVGLSTRTFPSLRTVTYGVQKELFPRSSRTDNKAPKYKVQYSCQISRLVLSATFSVVSVILLLRHFHVVRIKLERIN